MVFLFAACCILRAGGGRQRLLHEERRQLGPIETKSYPSNRATYQNSGVLSEQQSPIKTTTESYPNIAVWMINRVLSKARNFNQNDAGR